jgi:hypothetical protein
MMSCVICTVHKEMRGACFLIWPQNQCQLRFGDLGLKITVTVSWLGPQNQAAMVCRLCHKTDGRRTKWDTC